MSINSESLKNSKANTMAYMGSRLTDKFTVYAGINRITYTPIKKAKDVHMVPSKNSQENCSIVRLSSLTTISPDNKNNRLMNTNPPKSSYKEITPE